MTANRASEIADLVHSLAEPLEAAGFRYMLVGALASIHYGEARMTRDIDISVDVAGRSADEIKDALAATGLEVAGPERNEFGLRFVVPTHLVPAEIYLSGQHPYTQAEFDRARSIEWGKRSLVVISAEDLVLRKVYNLRLRRHHKDRDDVQAILARQGSALDVPYMRERARLFRTRAWLDELLKEAGIPFD